MNIECCNLNFYQSNICKYISLGFDFWYKDSLHSVKKNWSLNTYWGCERLIKTMNNENKLKKIMAEIIKKKIRSVENGIDGLQNKYKGKIVKVYIEKY